VEPSAGIKRAKNALWRGKKWCPTGSQYKGLTEHRIKENNAHLKERNEEKKRKGEN